MKNGLRLILIVLKTAAAAYVIGYVGLSWLQQLRQKIGKVRWYATEGAWQ